PDNIFESKFMIALLAPFMKSCQGSCSDYNKPKGALCLGATAVSSLSHILYNAS
ncbi:hypothetical protein BJV74DRAFT_772310, partial [Russula compacta]